MKTSQIDTNLPHGIPGVQHYPIPRPITPIARKLNHLATLGGLTSFEREFVAALRNRNEGAIGFSELQVLTCIWNRHGGG